MTKESTFIPAERIKRFDNVTIIVRSGTGMKNGPGRQKIYRNRRELGRECVKESMKETKEREGEREKVKNQKGKRKREKKGKVGGREKN